MKRSGWICSVGGLCLAVVFVGSAWMGSLSAAAKAPTAGGSPYEMDIQPLTTAECGRCHFSIFQTIKHEGGKHQIDCVLCHREYHVYSPRKNNYDDIMPDCAWCHQSATGGPFHGDHKALTPCLTCHQDPHRPLVIPMDQISGVCGPCHAPVAKEIADFPSAHQSDVACGDCHADEHGYIPECSMCHESHSPAVAMTSKDCMVCHPVHRPLEIAYAETTESKICAGCHGDAYDALRRKVTKHTPVTCADCHPSHGEIPACSRCHGQPHPESMQAVNCGECHGVAHDLTM